MVSPATLDSLSPSSVASVYSDVAYGQDLLYVVRLRFNAAVVNGIVCTVFWAVLSGLVLLASAVVWRNRTRSRSSWIPALSILVLYLLSTIYWATSALFALYAFSQELTRISNGLLHDAHELACNTPSDCQPSGGGGDDDPTNGCKYVIIQSVLPNITFSLVVGILSISRLFFRHR
ncbi:hypothetical protein BD413DRAFT_273182 [Trametes elegans]|nr:hypothetical protein BD413DRAFT_273182 [Trametes elegans]